MKSIITLVLIMVAGSVMAADETKEQMPTSDSSTTEEHKQMRNQYQQPAEAKALQEQVEELQEQLENIPYEVDLPIQKN